MKYVTREGGATVTVFVPYDCNNHCPFCINKAEYADTSSFDIEEVIRSIRIMSVITPECDFVFTGGEPLANLEELGRMICAVHQKDTNHKVFINTTLPVNEKTNEEKLADFLNKMYKLGLITGVNVSRHLNKYVQECDDKIFKMLDFEPRINCVLYNLHAADKNIKEKLINFVERFKDITGYVQFRKDYVVTTPSNLYDEAGDEILTILKDTFEYVGPFGQYRMRCGYEFKYNGYKVTYHKTLPYSRIYLTNNSVALYDIIIKQDGTIKEDWDTCLDDAITPANRICNNIANELDLTAYKNVTYEEYK